MFQARYIHTQKLVWWPLSENGSHSVSQPTELTHEVDFLYPLHPLQSISSHLNFVLISNTSPALTHSTNIELLICWTNHIWNNNYNIYLEMFDVTQFIYHCYWYTSHSCVFIRYKLRHPSLLYNLSLFWLFLPYWLGPLYRPRITLANGIHP